MKEALFHCAIEEREEILAALREALATWPEVVFAYVHGSFLENRPFHDIDLGVYVATPDERKAVALSMDLVMDLESAVMRSLREQGIRLAVSGRMGGELPGPRHLPVDVRVLNRAPASFCYHALRGHLLLCRDENVRVRWAEQVISRYLDLKPLRYRALKEAMTAWSSIEI